MLKFITYYRDIFYFTKYKKTKFKKVIFDRNQRI